MKRQWVLLIVLASCTAVWAQTEHPNSGYYQPAVPPPTNVNVGGGYYGGTTGASTAAGSAMNGMASVISASGQANLANSAAAVNYTQAQRNAIQNQGLWTDTYFQMRETNRAYRAKERGPKPTMEQITRMAREGTPRPLNTSQIDPVTGKLQWPGPLQADNFETERQTVDDIMAKRASLGGLNYTDQSAARASINAMFAALKAQVREIPPPDYSACRTFLNSVLYAVSRTEL